MYATTDNQIKLKLKRICQIKLKNGMHFELYLSIFVEYSRTVAVDQSIERLNKR